MSDELETTLAEAERIAADIGRAGTIHAPLAAWTLKCCELIRRLVTEGDAAGAGVAGIMLGGQLAALRNLDDNARQNMPASPIQRAHERDVERRRAYQAARDRGLSPKAAYADAGRLLGVSAKSIERAVNGH